MTRNHSPSINNDTVQIPCLLYADGVVTLSQTKTGHQNKLDPLCDYCNAWGLQINRDKPKVIIFTCTDPKSVLFFKCGNDIIETTHYYKYLGIIFCKRESFIIAQDHLAKQTNKHFKAFRGTFRNESIRVDAITQLSDSLVLPILTCGSEVWYPCTEQLTGDHTDTFKNSTGSKQPHENAHIKFCRQTLGVHNKAIGIPVPTEVGRFPISLKIVGQVIAFWSHVITSDVESYARKIYSDMTEHQSTDKDPWLSFIINVFSGIRDDPLMGQSVHF